MSCFASSRCVWHCSQSTTGKNRQLYYKLNELNSCWNSAYCRVFGFHRWEPVRSFICGLGRLDLKLVIILRKCRWLCRIRSSQNSLILNLFWVNVLDSKNVFLLAALGRYPEAVERITQMFSDSCAVG